VGQFPQDLFCKKLVRCYLLKFKNLLFRWRACHQAQSIAVGAKSGDENVDCESYVGQCSSLQLGPGVSFDRSEEASEAPKNATQDIDVSASSHKPKLESE
jgi:hypothetical protein